MVFNQLVEQTARFGWHKAINCKASRHEKRGSTVFIPAPRPQRIQQSTRRKERCSLCRKPSTMSGCSLRRCPPDLCLLEITLSSKAYHHRVCAVLRDPCGNLGGPTLSDSRIPEQTCRVSSGALLNPNNSSFRPISPNPTISDARPDQISG